MQPHSKFLQVTFYEKEPRSSRPILFGKKIEKSRIMLTYKKNDIDLDFFLFKKMHNTILEGKLKKKKTFY